MSVQRAVTLLTALIMSVEAIWAKEPITVERAVVPLTHEAVARAYPENAKGFPVVGDAAVAGPGRWADLFFRYHFVLRNSGEARETVGLEEEVPADFALAREIRVEPEQVEIGPGEQAAVTLVVQIPGEAAATLPAGYTRELGVRFASKGFSATTQRVVFWVPAVAKILAGADGKGLPADVLPPGADYADEFSGGWDGTRFKSPFLMATGTQIADWRKTVAQGLKPDRQDQYWHHGNAGMLATASKEMIADKRGHETASPMGEAILNLALSWAYTGNKTDAERAGELILAYVERAKRLGFGQNGRVGTNLLSCAWFTNPVFRAIDLLEDAEVLSDAEMKRIQHWMLYQANVIQDQIIGLNNMQCEANYPVMVAGLICGDFKYLRFAYYPPYGMQGHLSGAFYTDGFHREKQAGYHYRSINPIADQAEALLRLGFCAYDERVHRALMNPVRRAAAPGDDLGGEDVRACEIAYLRYRDPLAADWLRLRRRRERLPLFQHALPLPEASGSYWQQPGTHLPISGQTVLRTTQTPDDIRAVNLHWGFSGKRQGRDFMDCRFLYAGRVFGDGDFGVNDSLGHGVVLVNEQSMNECGGFPVELDLDGAFPYVVAANPSPQQFDDTYGAIPWPYTWKWKMSGAGTFLPLGVPGNRERGWTAMYDGATWTRTVAAIHGGFLIADRVELDAPGRIDRPLHLSMGFNSLKELTTSVKLTEQPGAIGDSKQYQAAIPGLPAAPKAPTDVSREDRGTDDVLGELDPAEDQRSDIAGPRFPQAVTDSTWTANAFNQHAEHSFSVQSTVLGALGTRIIKVQSLPLGFGYHNPFIIIRHDGVKVARFITFIEPYGYSGKMNVCDTVSRPKIQGMKRLSVSAEDGQLLTDDQATALTLDFGDQQVVVILNDSGEPVRTGGLRTVKRFAAHCDGNKQSDGNKQKGKRDEDTTNR